MTNSPDKHFTVYCDGAARGNPGPGSYGFVILDQGSPVVEMGGVLGKVTNNVAEYQGVIHALQKCHELGATAVTLRSDSELLVRQLNGQYKVRAPHLKELADSAKSLLQLFGRWRIEHVRREDNARADQLANWALDGRLGPDPT